MKRKTCSIESASRSSNHLILLTRAGKAIAVHRPEGNSIAVGRSSSSKIRVSDPHFPRFAGEVILRPTPLFRTPERGRNKSRLIPMKPGRPLRLPPYKLFLLEEGDVFRNRRRSLPFNLKTIVLLKPLRLAATGIIVLALAAAGSVQHRGSALLAGPDPTVPFHIGHRMNFTVRNQSDEEKAILPAVVHRKERKVNPPGLSERRPRETRVRVDGSTFSSVLKQAERLLASRDAGGAGKLIVPLLPFLSKTQRGTAVRTLNPYAEKIYLRAYILRPFHREESDRMMRELALCGLELLPVVRKAKGINNATGRM